jgi:hypothetical protein
MGEYSRIRVVDAVRNTSFLKPRCDHPNGDTHL